MRGFMGHAANVLFSALPGAPQNKSPPASSGELVNFEAAGDVSYGDNNLAVTVFVSALCLLLLIKIIPFPKIFTTFILRCNLP